MVTNNSVHAPVMMSPIGKVPKVVPGNTTLPLTAAFALAVAAAVLLAAFWSEKGPDKKEASSVESCVVTVDPFSALPDSAI